MINYENEICKNCQSKDSIIMDYELGHLVCNQCGLVYEERIIADEDEKRTFHDDNGDNQIHRVGLPQNPAFGNECGTNLIIRDKGKTKVYKDYSNISKSHRNFMRIDRFLSSLNIPCNLKEQTKELFDKISKNHTTMKGRNLNHIYIGAYYYACCKLKMAKTFKQIAEEFNVTERIVKRAFNNIKYDVTESPKEEENNNGIYDICKNYIQTFLGGNIENYDVRILSFEIIKNIIRNVLLEGKNPKTISGLALIISFALYNDNSYDKKELYKFFSNKNTLAKSYKEIKDKINLIVPQKYKDIIPNIFIPL